MAEIKKNNSDSKRLRVKIEEITKERDLYKHNFQRLQSQIQRTKPPLLIASVTRIFEDEYCIIHTPSGNDFLVQNPFKDLSPGDSVGIDQTTFNIIKILPPNVDRFVAGMELDEKPEETYADVGGLDEVILSLREVVELAITNPKIFKTIGIKPPNGVLLEGDPGTGKTLLARAVANATQATFIRLVGSELVQKYIGEGARLVRELFALARDRAPCILFIDEIDAIASKRTPDSQVSDREVQRTLMQLLAEMDGFNELGNVKILAATNRPDILDPAILRPGRFDRIIHVPEPDPSGRLQIFKIHTRKMPMKDVKLSVFAQKWEKLTGADIKAICVEAGLNAIRNNRYIVTHNDFEVGYNRYFRKLQDKRIGAAVYS
jgi:proteasome regulatory subunit